jgi:peptidoglycan/LPS O-acetylase OafA/YrhL
MDEITTHSQFLFIVRIWLVEEGRDRAWRGSVEQVPSGQKLYFTSLGDLDDFIAGRLSAAAANPNKRKVLPMKKYWPGLFILVLLLAAAFTVQAQSDEQPAALTTPSGAAVHLSGAAQRRNGRADQRHLRPDVWPVGCRQRRQRRSAWTVW